MTRLFIAEKPSVGRALAAELGHPRKKDGYIETDNGLVAWCRGHLVELAEPDEYLPDDVPTTSKGKKVWRAEDLPIIPEKWIYQPKKETKAMLNTLGALLKRKDITELVNVGDPDREGQFLVDLVIEYFRCNKPCLRLLANGIDSYTLQRGLKTMKPIEETRGMSEAARARGQADWLTGINLSRAYTLSAQRGGESALLVVGRVQTPTLNLVVMRDRTIENFIPIDFFKIDATFIHENGSLTMNWKNTVERDGIDEEGRIIDKAVAQTIVKNVKGADGIISSYESKKKKQNAPIPFSLTELTALASKLHGYTAATVLKIAQSLYETHKVTSYPRTDTGYLPESQHAEAPEVLNAVKSNIPSLLHLVDNADTSIMSSAFNTAKTSAHHGVIPTSHRAPRTALNEEEAIIYELIVRRYIAQFYPPMEYQDTRIEATVQDERFTTQGKRIITPGWREVLTGGGDATDKGLPQVSKGDPVNAFEAAIKAAKTSPPKHFTEGTLIVAMENIHRYFQGSKDDKEMLKITKGLSTSATRTSILEELKRRKYLKNKGRSIVSTELGQNIIDVYPETIKSVYTTAINERKLKEIADTGQGITEFMESQVSEVVRHVDEVKSRSVEIKGVEVPSQKKKRAPIKRRTRKATGSEHACEACGSALVRRVAKVKGTAFWGCSGFPRCNQTYSDKSGQPSLSAKQA